MQKWLSPDLDDWEHKNQKILISVCHSTRPTETFWRSLKRLALRRAARPKYAPEDARLRPADGTSENSAMRCKCALTQDGHCIILIQNIDHRSDGICASRFWPLFRRVQREAFLFGAGLVKRHVELGLLHSRSGSYALLSQASQTGAIAAIAAINSDAEMPVQFAPVLRDPAGNADAYGPLCEEILRETTARHVVGCVTSLSRK